MVGKAEKRMDGIDNAKLMNDQTQQNFGLLRSQDHGTQRQRSYSIGTANLNPELAMKLDTRGGVMRGALGFLGLATAELASNGILDTSEYNVPRLYITNTSLYTLKVMIPTITDGQEIWIRNNSASPFTIQNTAGAGNETTGNIELMGGANLTFGIDDWICFHYDITDAKFKQVTAGKTGGGGSISYPITPDINDLSDTWTGTQTIDLSAAEAHITKIILDQNLTLGTPTNPPSSGTQIEFEIEFVQDATGGFTVTQFAEVAETVSISKTALTTTIVTYRTNDGGTTYHAIPALRGAISLSGAGGFLTAVVDDTSPDLGGILTGSGFDQTGMGTISMLEQAAANADVAGSGQLWVKTATPNQLWFTADDGSEFEIGSANTPDGSATYDHLEWNGSAWTAQASFSFQATAASAGFLRFANNSVTTAWRNAADGGDCRVYVDTTDDYHIDGIDEFWVESPRTGAGGAASLISYRNNQTPIESELGSLRFDGNNDNVSPEQIQFFRILAGIADVTDGSEEGHALIQVTEGGVELVSYMSFNLAKNGSIGIAKPMLMAASLDMDDNRIDLDADNDTSIRASADDTIQFEVGGLDAFIIEAAGGFRWNVSGVGHQMVPAATSFSIALGASSDDFLIDFNGATATTSFRTGAIEIFSDGSTPLLQIEKSDVPSNDDVLFAIIPFSRTFESASQVAFGDLRLVMTDVTENTEDSDWIFKVRDGGVDTTILTLDGSQDEVVLGTATNLEMASGSIQSCDNIEIDGALNHDGNTDASDGVGFYGTAPVAKQLSVAVTAAGVHAALVNLGLIT